ncbi:LysR family transcriptional regulator [soil metagenome]
MKTTLEELLAFRTVVDAGSITAAAEQLAQTVSGISRSLQRLESKLGTTLLTRTTRRLSLTEEGRSFLAHARSILSAVDVAEDQMSARHQQPAGRLRVNASAPFMLHVAAPLIGEFRALYPQIELELNSDDVVIDLLQESTDIAIRTGRLRDSTLHSRTLGSNRMRVLASPAYLLKHGKVKSVAQLADPASAHVLLGFAQPDSLNRWPLRGPHGDRLGIAPSLRASGETLRRLALDGVGIVCLSDFMTAHDRELGDLVQVLPRDTVELLQPIHAVFYRNTQLASRISCFLDFMAARVAAMSWYVA